MEGAQPNTHGHHTAINKDLLCLINCTWANWGTQVQWTAELLHPIAKQDFDDNRVAHASLGAASLAKKCLGSAEKFPVVKSGFNTGYNGISRTHIIAICSA